MTQTSRARPEATSGEGADAARLAGDAIAAWETDGGATAPRAEPRPAANDGLPPGVRTTRVTRLALIWPYDAARGVVAGIWPLDGDAIAGVVAGGYRVLATVREHPPYTHVIGARGGQDYLVTLATVWANAADGPPFSPPRA